MTPDDAQTCLGAIRARWPYQPMSDDQRKAWHRTLRRFDLPTFGEALDSLAAGSPSANQPGQRPTVSEFVAAAQAIVRRQALERSQAQREAEPWPETSPEDVRRHLDEIRAQHGYKRAVGA